ncbi:MAG: isoaspartyl peptidase/L-asparaginase [Gemmatimonadota bacterium]|nr:isoaspartyl peptidase/L-asparaginase [Gemmatimonadota bacterium]
MRTIPRFASALGATTLALLLTLLAAPSAVAQSGEPSVGPVIAIHGGAGTIRRENMDPETEAAIRAKLAEALETGYAVLDEGGPALDAVEAAIRVMEDSPLFNAGKGAVFTHEGRNELDSSIMDGASRDAGAVAGVAHVKNPISLARRVMTDSPHVMLAREGAEEFALEIGVELVPSSYFFTPRRWESLQRVRERQRERQSSLTPVDSKLGTVGAVALDRSGNLAAGTSTGGMTNKRWGRIGDSPIVGAATWADEACAISSTGHGEYFIRWAVAHDVCARMRYKEISLSEAADEVVMRVLVEAGGDGGIIALDADGNIVMPFNTAGMYRGYRVPGADPVTLIYGDETTVER